MLEILGTQVSRGFLDVLITATAEVYQEDVFWLHSRCALQGVGDGVTRLKGGENAFKAAELLKSGERRRVGGVGIVDAAVLPVVGVFRPHSGIVHTGGNGMSWFNLAIVVLKNIGLAALKDA